MGWEETLAVVACRCSVHRPLWPGPGRQLADISSRKARRLRKLDRYMNREWIHTSSTYTWSRFWLKCWPSKFVVMASGSLPCQPFELHTADSQTQQWTHLTLTCTTNSWIVCLGIKNWIMEHLALKWMRHSQWSSATCTVLVRASLAWSLIV
jgi:hypothetical protein